MKQYLLECCVDSVESAINAQRGGADRLELCANLVLGGTTPGIKLFEEVCKYTTIPIRVLLRPRFGDFLYTDYEYSIMKEEAIMFREAGAEGLVVGCLTQNGTIDLKRMVKLKELAEDRRLTVHRAFDVTRDPFEALTQCIELGADTILTSGQQNNCLEGKALLKELDEKSEGRIKILAGGGVDTATVRELLQTTGITQFHMSGKELVDSQMSYRKEKVNMGLADLSEYQILRTCQQKIEEVKEILMNYK